MRDLGAVIRLEQALADTETGGDVVRALHGVATAAGLSMYGAWRLAPRADNFRSGYVSGRNVFMHESMPKTFWGGYRALALKFGLSVTARLAWEDRAPFSFTEALRVTQPRAAERWIFDYWRSFGIRDGFYCPVGGWNVVFWTGRVLDLAPRDRRLLSMAAIAAALRLEEIVGPRSRPRHAAGLTPPEIDVLQLLAAGFKPAQIAQRLDIALGTVRTDVYRAMKKLKAKSREQAIAIAVRRFLVM